MDEESGEREVREVTALHADVDETVQALVLLHADRLQCRRGCAACCIDELSVYEVEADRIRENCAEVLVTAAHPPGSCAFLDQAGACRIYSDRPYVCRTQGLPLRWFAEDSHGATLELRDICPLNETDAPIEELPEATCWLIGPTEGRLGALQSKRNQGAPRRVALRDLFRANERK